MLNKDLLRFVRRGGFKPAFIDAKDANLLDFAARLIEIYQQAAAARMRRGELEELCEGAIRTLRDQKLAGGLAKLLADRAEFDPVRELDYPAMRHKLFICASQALQKCEGCIDHYRELLRADSDNQEFMAADIYGDLPELERLSGFRPLNPTELLCRYNLALVQGLLFYTDTLELRVRDDNPAELRRLFKYLKFFRLLAEARRAPRKNGPNAMELTISGPFALFANSRKYALQLAAFFPAVVNLSEWSIRAKITLAGLKGELKLDQTAGLVSHYRNFSSYVPEEIRMFHKLFAEQSQEWKIVGETPFIDGVKPELIFPDLSFRKNASGVLIHLELFHRWHRGQLERRLEFLENHLQIALLIGIDRALADDAEFAALQARYPNMASRLYRFRDFPGVDRTLRLLEKNAESFEKPLKAKISSSRRSRS